MPSSRTPRGLVVVAGLQLAALAACAEPAIPAPTGASQVSAPTPLAGTPSPSSRAETSGMATIDISTLTGRIVFSGGPPHGEDVYVVNADGTGLQRVTNDAASEFDPTWSPDGEQIAYRHQPGDDRTTDIWVIGADGRQPRNLSGDDGRPDWGPAWSPDGVWIAWNTAPDTGVGFNLGLIHPDGTGRSVVTPSVWVEYPAWSPDGTQIAFMSQVAEEGSQYDVFVMNADGSDVRRLTTTPAEDGWPTWSPDGQSIAFSSTRDDCSESSASDCLSTGDIGPFHTLYLMAPDGTNQHRLSAAFAQIADWSPDGRYLIFEGRSGLSLASADDSATAVIPLGVALPGFPDWIP